jgi:hypothetical protein
MVHREEHRSRPNAAVISDFDMSRIFEMRVPINPTAGADRQTRWVLNIKRTTNGAPPTESNARKLQ